MMYVHGNKVLNYLRHQRVTKEQFAEELGISLDEMDKLLAGDGVEFKTAEAFVNFFGAVPALYYIDLKKSGIEDKVNKGKI